MRKKERLLNLLCLLWSSQRRFTREEIFRRMAPYRNYANPETARRTFERDKKALRQVGFDIQTSPPEEGPATYALARPHDALANMELTDSERMALAVAVAMVDLGGALPVDRTLVKLGASAAIGKGTTNLAMGDLETEKVHDLLRAVQSRSPVFFDYKGTRRQSVEPLRILNRRSRWYLLAREAETVKVFRIDLLSELNVSQRENMYDLESIPEAPSILTSEWWEFGEEEAVATTIRFDAESAWYVRPRIPTSAQVAEDEDGSLVVVTQVIYRDSFFSWLLDLGAEGEIVAPQSMRQDLVAWVKQSMREVGP